MRIEIVQRNKTYLVYELQHDGKRRSEEPMLETESVLELISWLCEELELNK